MKKGLMISLRAFSDFIPLIFLWSIPNHKGMISGFILSFLLVTIKGFKKEIGLMTKVVFIYFIIINIFYFYFNIELFFEKRALISYLVLTGMCFLSIKFNRPFTMDASKKAYKSIEKTPLFIKMNNLISTIFGICYLINTILAYFESSMISMISPSLTAFAVVSSIILPSFMPDA